MKNFVIDTTECAKGEFLPFREAKSFVRSLGLQSSREWYVYSKSSRPSVIPSNPQTFYKKEWAGFPDFLGYEFNRSDSCLRRFKKYSINIRQLVDDFQLLFCCNNNYFSYALWTFNSSNGCRIYF